MTVWIICIAAAYLAGSIPFGVMLARARGVDIREHGSGNIGATNVGRVLGRRLGLVCFLLDVFKGAVPVLASGFATGVIGRPVEAVTAQQMWSWLAVGAAAVLGHMASIFIRFRGGKGVATGFGTMVAMWPLLTIPALAVLVVWYAVLRLTRYVAAASMTAAVCLPLAYLLSIIPNSGDDVWDRLRHGSPPLIVTVLLALLVVYRHRSNIGRIVRGEEPKVKGAKRRGDVVEDG